MLSPIGEIRAILTESDDGDAMVEEALVPPTFTDYEEVTIAVIPSLCVQKACSRAIRMATYCAVDCHGEQAGFEEARRRTLNHIGKICSLEVCTEAATDQLFA